MLPLQDRPQDDRCENDGKNEKCDTHKLNDRSHGSPSGNTPECFAGRDFSGSQVIELPKYTANCD